MSINVADNFNYQGSKPLDARFQFSTVAAMKAYAEASLYNGCLAYITGTKEYYTYDSSNTVDSTTGRWRIFESGSGGASALSDLTDTTISNPSSGQVLKYNGSKWENSAVPSDSAKQPKTLDTPIIVGETSVTTVEGALSALNNKEAGIASVETLNFPLSSNQAINISANQTKFYFWEYTGNGTTITNYKLPELDTTTFPYNSYRALIMISVTSTSGFITVFYEIDYSGSTSVNKAYFSRTATQKVDKSGSSYYPVGEWMFSNSNIVSPGDFNLQTNAFDPMDYAIPEKTVVFTGTATNPTYKAYLPIPTQGSSLSGNYRYTYFITDPNNSFYHTMQVLCMVMDASHGRVTSVRLFYNNYNTVAYDQVPVGFTNWVEIGGGSIDTTKIYSTDDTAETSLDDADYVPFYDTSATAKRKSLWSNIKSVLKTYFDPYYKLVAGTNIGLTDDTNNRIISATNTISLNYSTSEQAIGTWIDNKTLYQRTYTGTLSTSTNSNTVVATLVSSAKVINIEGIAEKSGYRVLLPYIQGNVTIASGKSAGLYRIGIYVTDTNQVTVGNYLGDSTYPFYEGATYYITVRYTKS